MTVREMILCAKCAGYFRERNIVRKVPVGVGNSGVWSGVCENCKFLKVVTRFEIEPKRRKDNE